MIFDQQCFTDALKQLMIVVIKESKLLRDYFLFFPYLSTSSNTVPCAEAGGVIPR